MAKNKKKAARRVGNNAPQPISDKPPVPTTRPGPNRALKEVREATKMTQNEFASVLEVSAPYIQAVELGQRQVNADLAQRLESSTGVWYPSILEGWQQAVDCYGEPYTAESYKRFRSSVAERVTDEEIVNFLKPLAALARAAAKRGKLTVLGAIMRRKLEEIMRQLNLHGPLNEILKKQDAPVAKKITVGELRKNPSMGILLGFKDDPERNDDDVITLQGLYEERVNPALTWFPPIEWYPRAEEIQRKYEQRCTAIPPTPAVLPRSAISTTPATPLKPASSPKAVPPKSAIPLQPVPPSEREFPSSTSLK